MANPAYRQGVSLILRINERTYSEWCSKHQHFFQTTTRAIGQSKISLVEKLRKADGWHAQAFLLEWRWPNEFGPVAERPLLASSGSANHAFESPRARHFCQRRPAPGVPSAEAPDLRPRCSRRLPVSLAARKSRESHFRTAR